MWHIIIRYFFFILGNFIEVAVLTCKKFTSDRYSDFSMVFSYFKFVHLLNCGHCDDSKNSHNQC